MKKILSLLLVCILLVGCGKEDNSPKSVSEVIKSLKDDGLPIADEVEYSQENDPNELLGRPGEYVQKINFNDNDVIERQTEESIKDLKKSETDAFKFDKKAIDDHRKSMSKLNRDKLDCTIEMFENSKDLDARAKKIEALSGLANQYVYKKGKFLLRISYDVTPDNAKKYEESFKKLFEK